jgi:hypothetical protein
MRLSSARRLRFKMSRYSTSYACGRLGNEFGIEGRLPKWPTDIRRIAGVRQKEALIQHEALLGQEPDHRLLNGLRRMVCYLCCS